jgi:hypothetical protein
MTLNPRPNPTHLEQGALSSPDTYKISDEAQRAAYVAWLLCIQHDHVYPLRPEWNEGDDEHLFSVVLTTLQELVAEARRATDHCPDAIRYMSMLSHADGVMEGRETPPASGEFQNCNRYRRGRYVFRPGTVAAPKNKKPEAR